jgi:hypothetical protein
LGLASFNSVTVTEMARPWFIESAENLKLFLWCVLSSLFA